jgi:hypothetical protein
MASESSRETSVRRFAKPDDPTTYVDGPVVDVISFIDANDRYQESEHTFDNTSENLSRETHTVTVTGIDDPSSTIDVERIDSFDTTDERDSFQEAITSLFNTDDPPKHLQTHTIKVFNVDDNSIWYKVQRVDRFSVIDARSQYQEKIYQLKWDDGSNASDDGEGDTDLDNTENSAYDSNLDEPDTSSDGTEINPPWRLDPFQNIVDVSWGKSFVVFFGAGKIAIFPMSVLDGKSATPIFSTGSVSARQYGVQQFKFDKGYSPYFHSWGLAYGTLGGLPFGSPIVIGAPSGAQTSQLPPQPTISGVNETGTIAGLYSWVDSTVNVVTGSVATTGSFTPITITTIFPVTESLSVSAGCGGSVDVNFPSFSQSGGYDKLAKQTSAATMSFSGSGGGSYTYVSPVLGNGVSAAIYSGACSFLGISWSLSVTDTTGFFPPVGSAPGGAWFHTYTQTYADTYAFLTFPPWPSGKPYYVATHYDATTGAVTSSDVVTPYETLASAGQAQGWMHVSNGKHAIQAVTTSTDSGVTNIPVIYLNGARFEARLAGLCGCAPSAIHKVIMDARASDWT